MTFCETVLAAAIATDRSQFDSVLRNVRYHQRHRSLARAQSLFLRMVPAQCREQYCRWVRLDDVVDINKTVDSQPGLDKRRFAMSVTPTAGFLASSKLERGDIVGFVSRRPDLDYFHTGFVAFDKTGVLLLRHASQSRHRVLDERMDASCQPAAFATLRWCAPRSHARLRLRYKIQAAAAFGFTSAV